MGWWTRGAPIGRGSSATVFLATGASAAGELLAVKSADLSCSSLLQKEQELISQLSSPYIVDYLGYDITWENGKPIYNLLMEYMPNGTLSDLIKKQNGGSLSESMIQFYSHQILQGLNYLHSNGIVHCDIKGQNILIGKQDCVKIADLGCARQIAVDQIPFNNKFKPATISGTPIFMAPEVARGEEQGFPADIWALGCTIIEMATGANPWPEFQDPVSALYRIGYSGDVPEIPKWFSSNAKEFLKICFRRDPKERWTAKKLLDHPFFQEIGTKIVRNSPTSILDQGFFWDSIEISEFSQESSQVVSSFSSSPIDRIKKLIGSEVSNLPNWTEEEDEEDWVTVRGIVQDEIPQVLEKNQDYEVSISEESSIESSISIEDFQFNSLLDDEIDNIENLVVRNDHMMYFEIVKDAFILSVLDSEIPKIRTKVLQLIILEFFYKLLFFHFF